LSYSTRDSTLKMFYKPILWSQQQQISGDFMQLFTKNKKADYLHIQKSAMVISHESDSLYNQLSGKDLKAFFDSGQVVRIEIKGNAETVYLPRDEKTKEVIGLNRLEGSSLTIFMENKKMKKLVVWPQPKGKFYPLNKIASDARYLKNFAWFDKIRPTGPEDVLREIKEPVKLGKPDSKANQKADSTLISKGLKSDKLKSNKKTPARNIRRNKK